MTTGRIRALVFGSMLLIPAASQAAPIDVTLETNKTRYYPGEALIFTVTAYNHDSQDAVLSHAPLPPALYILDGTDTYPNNLIYSDGSVARIPANGSYTWQHRHLWRAKNLDLGTHSVVGRVTRAGDSSVVPFEVIEPVLPTQSFVMDFDRLSPQGSPVSSVEEYWSSGVYFHRAAGWAAPIEEENGNQFVSSGNGTGYPPGFNIIADFKMPVYGATVDVSGGTGATITMIAKDASGHVLGSVTSERIPEYREFIGPLSITSDTPIASLEWWPDMQGAKVMIDNLQVSIPEPVSALVLPVGTAFLIFRRTRRPA